MFLAGHDRRHVVVWSSNVDRARSRPARHARHGVRCLHFILTIIGLGAGPQVIGILNDIIGPPEAIRYSLLFVAVVMNLLAAWFFWLTGKTLVEDLRAKERL